MNSEKKFSGKINNLSNYLQYCESLKHILKILPLMILKLKRNILRKFKLPIMNLEQ